MCNTLGNLIGDSVGGTPKNVYNKIETLNRTENANKLGSTTEEINDAHKKKQWLSDTG